MDNKNLNSNVDSNKDEKALTSSNSNPSPSEKKEEAILPKEATPALKSSNQESKTPDISLPEGKKAEQSSPIVIPESNEKKEEVKAQNQTLNPTVDFSSIFNVASEETPEKPKEVAPPKTEKELAPEVKVQEETSSSAKPTPQFNKDQFNSEEKLLYEIKPEKDGNPIVVLFFFVFLILFIIFLPSIVKVADFKFTPAKTPSETTQKKEDELYEIGSTAVRVTIGDLELNNFVKSYENNEHYLIFTLTNTKGQPYMFDKKYYITLYDTDVVVGYALIHSYDIVSAYGATEVKAVINESAYNKANHFKVEEIVPSRYPTTTTIETDGEYEVLTCNHLNDEIKYYFSNDSLIKISETYKETQIENKTYTTDRDTYRNISEQYKQIENFSSTFIETDTDFTMKNDIELKDIPDKTLTDLKVYRYFRYSENLNTVAFEIEAQGYTCR